MHWIAPFRRDTYKAAMDYNAIRRIHEYFLGELYIPSSIVRLLTEDIETYHGRN